VLGVSSDSEKSHQNFIKKFELNFDLISDEDKTVHKLYGTWVEKNMYGRKYMGTARNTFIIDEDGIITDIITKVKTKEHSNQIISE
jgi:peroxiredoxin Q/BCP